MDLLPTFCDIATDGKGVHLAAPVDGNSLLGLAAGSKKGWSNTVFGEYMAEGTFQPAFMIRRDRWKYVSCAGDPPQLYDVPADPHELPTSPAIRSTPRSPRPLRPKRPRNGTVRPSARKSWRASAIAF